MNEVNLSIKYAKAFFNVYGLSLQEIDFWKIKHAAAVLVKNKAILNVFILYKQAEQQKIREIILNHFNLSSSFASLLFLLQRHQRVLLLPNILNELVELFLHNNRKLFFQISSYPLLSTFQQNQVVAYLQRATGMEILYKIREDQALISGIKMQSSQLLYEDSINYRLRKIQRKLIRQI